MKKRISIQYSIDESNVANECYRLLDNTLSRLTSIAAITPPTESIVNPTTLREISSLRDELSSIDIELGDVHAIIDGFLAYQYSNNAEHAQPTNKDKIDIPDFLNQNAGNINLDELAAFVEQIKGSTAENFNMDDVSSLSPTTQNFETDSIDPNKVKQIVEEFKNSDLQGVDPQDILNSLSTLQNGSAKFEEIGDRLKDLKARIDSSEVTD